MPWMLILIGFLTSCTHGTLAQPTGPTGSLPQDRAVEQPVAIATHKMTAGEVLFIRRCAGCHGASARGDGPVGTALGIRPRSLRQAGLFPEDRDDEWVNRILHGNAARLEIQASQKTATEDEVEAVLQHLRRFSTLRWEEVDRGEKVYDSLCLSCHGIYGHGDGTLAATLRVRPRDLLTPPYQQQLTDEMLFQRISDGHGAMSGTADVLSVDDRKAVVQFIRLLTPGYESYDRYCVACHGNRGQPVNQEILALLGQADTWKPPPPMNKEFFSKRTDDQLRTSIRRMLTINRAPMPHFAGEITADDVRSVLKYLRSLPPES